MENVFILTTGNNFVPFYLNLFPQRMVHMSISSIHTLLYFLNFWNFWHMQFFSYITPKILWIKGLKTYKIQSTAPNYYTI